MEKWSTRASHCDWKAGGGFSIVQPIRLSQVLAIFLCLLSSLSLRLSSMTGRKSKFRKRRLRSMDSTSGCPSVIRMMSEAACVWHITFRCPQNTIQRHSWVTTSELVKHNLPSQLISHWRTCFCHCEKPHEKTPSCIVQLSDALSIAIKDALDGLWDSSASTDFQS